MDGLATSRNLFLKEHFSPSMFSREISYFFITLSVNEGHNYLVKSKEHINKDAPTEIISPLCGTTG